MSWSSSFPLLILGLRLHVPAVLGATGGASCPGTVSIAGSGTASLVNAAWNVEGDSSGKVEVVQGSGQVVPHMNGRTYFAETCTTGVFDHKQYMALNLLGKTLRYTVDLRGAGCGCNAALYLTSLRQSTNPSKCHDYYCDANNVCGQSCAEIDIQEANQFAWHSTLHTSQDHSGKCGGYGGGSSWNGPRDWLGSQYGPGAQCIDTTVPFSVAASFPVNAQGQLEAMEVKLSQAGRECPLQVRLDNYDGMSELHQALAAGMTPIISYWSADDMLWMDGRGADGKGPCESDSADACADFVRFSNFSLDAIAGQIAPATPATTSWWSTESTVAPAAPATPDLTTAAPATTVFTTPLPAAPWGGQLPWGTVGDSAGVDFSPAAAPAPEPGTVDMPVAYPSDGFGAATSSVEKPAAPDGFCCMTSTGPTDLCGACADTARAVPGSICARSEVQCHLCSLQATWCPSGVEATVRKLEQPAHENRRERAPSASELAAVLTPRADKASTTTMTDTTISTTRTNTSTRTSTRTSTITTTSPFPDSSDESDDGSSSDFCCFAEGSCDECPHRARALSTSLCAGSEPQCKACSRQATWCSRGGNVSSIFEASALRRAARLPYKSLTGLMRKQSISGGVVAVPESWNSAPLVGGAAAVAVVALLAAAGRQVCRCERTAKNGAGGSFRPLVFYGYLPESGLPNSAGAVDSDIGLA